jgi:hypothetical protein
MRIEVNEKAPTTHTRRDAHYIYSTMPSVAQDLRNVRLAIPGPARSIAPERVASHLAIQPADEKTADARLSPLFRRGSRVGYPRVALSGWAVACEMALNDESAAVTRSSDAVLRGSAARGQTWLPTNV